MRREFHTLGVIFAVGLLYLAFRGVDWQELLGNLRKVQPAYMVLVCLMATCNSMVRSLRWRSLVGTDVSLPLLTVFWALMAGYLGNNFLPARAGELIRSVLLGRRVNLSSSFVLATAFTERVVDFLVLVLLGSIAILKLQKVPQPLLNAMAPLAVASLMGLLMLIGLPKIKKNLLGVLACCPLQLKWREKIRRIVDQFILGVSSLQKPKRAFVFLALTLGVWIFDAFITVVVARSLGMNFSIALAFLLNVTLGISSAIPSAPGYLGVYQFVAVTVLVPFGFSQGAALAYIVVFQGLSYGIVLLWGGVGIWRLHSIPHAPIAV